MLYDPRFLPTRDSDILRRTSFVRVFPVFAFDILARLSSETGVPILPSFQPSKIPIDTSMSLFSVPLVIHRFPNAGFWFPEFFPR